LCHVAGLLYQSAVATRQSHPRVRLGKFDSALPHSIVLSSDRARLTNGFELFFC
jgi:hypothetical protein